MYRYQLLQYTESAVAREAASGKNWYSSRAGNNTIQSGCQIRWNYATLLQKQLRLPAVKGGDEHCSPGVDEDSDLQADTVFTGVVTSVCPPLSKLWNISVIGIGLVHRVDCISVLFTKEHALVHTAVVNCHIFPYVVIFNNHLNFVGLEQKCVD